MNDIFFLLKIVFTKQTLIKSSKTPRSAKSHFLVTLNAHYTSLVGTYFSR